MSALLKTFIFIFPWELYSTSIYYLKISASIASGICALFIIAIYYNQLIKGFIFSWLTLVIFILNLMISSSSNSEFLCSNLSLVSSILMAIVSWVSLFIKKPVTLQYARQKVDISKWNNPLFIKINNDLTMLLAVVFSLCAYFNYLIRINLINGIFPQLIIFILLFMSITFTNSYPEYARKKNIIDMDLKE